MEEMYVFVRYSPFVFVSYMSLDAPCLKQSFDGFSITDSTKDFACVVLEWRIFSYFENF